MANIKEKLKLIKLRLRPSSRPAKIMLIVAIALAMVALITLRLAIYQLDSRTTDLRDKAAALEQENRDLRENIGILGSVQSVIQIAMDELGLVDPDTVILEPES